MQIKKLIIPAFTIFLFSACISTTNDQTSSLSVEAWIEQDSLASVYLMRSIGTNDEDFFTDYEDMITHTLITDAEVRISCDDVIDTLRLINGGKYKYGKFYKGTHLHGICGKSYKLNILWNGKELSAETTIPSVVNLDSVTISHESGDNYFLKGYFNNDSNFEDYYMFLIKKTAIPFIVLHI